VTPPGASSELPVEAGGPAGDRFAAALRGFGPLGIAAMLLVLARNFVLAPLSAVLALLWAYRSQTLWREIGYVRRGSWAMTAAGGVGFGVALKLMMKSVVMPWLGAPPINPAYQFLVGNAGATIEMLWVVVVAGGWGEETLFRGYLFERLGKLLGESPWARAAVVLLTSVVFGLLHLHDQGIAGAQQATITGLVFGSIFAATRQIWPLVVAHAAFDVTAVLIIYAGLERNIAHWFFR